jgi:hypothetical protein
LNLSCRQQGLQLHGQILLRFAVGRQLLAGGGSLDPLHGIVGSRGRSRGAEQNTYRRTNKHQFVFRFGLAWKLTSWGIASALRGIPLSVIARKPTGRNKNPRAEDAAALSYCLRQSGETPFTRSF